MQTHAKHGHTHADTERERERERETERVCVEGIRREKEICRNPGQSFVISNINARRNARAVCGINNQSP